MRVPLDDLKSVRAAFGGTVNDVVLAGIGGGLARLFDARSELTPDLVLNVFCPVSVRDDRRAAALGNRISAMFVPLAVGEPDPLARLARVRATTADLKERNQAVGAVRAARAHRVRGADPARTSPRAPSHHQPFFNLVCTNIPGPQVAAVLHGRADAGGVPAWSRCRGT